MHSIKRPFKEQMYDGSTVSYGCVIQDTEIGPVSVVPSELVSQHNRSTLT